MKKSTPNKKIPKSSVGQYFADLKKEDEEFSKKYPYGNSNKQKKITKKS